MAELGSQGNCAGGQHCFWHILAARDDDRRAEMAGMGRWEELQRAGQETGGWLQPPCHLSAKELPGRIYGGNCRNASVSYRNWKL